MLSAGYKKRRGYLKLNVGDPVIGSINLSVEIISGPRTEGKTRYIGATVCGILLGAILTGTAYYAVAERSVGVTKEILHVATEVIKFLGG